jgi:photosystem II stability/assembly factor-like uncharacterized protein
MSPSVEPNSASIYENLNYAYDKVVFNPGNPPLGSELNTLQEQLEILTQKTAGSMPSGWLSYRPFYTSATLSNSFYTQDPSQPIPEVAMVNGWPIFVTNTNTDLSQINQINLNDFELKSGSRVDGVVLEVWRSLLTPQDTNVASKPTNVSQVSTIYSIYMYDEDLGWAVGDRGTILKTVNGGLNWNSIQTPISVLFTRVQFFDQSLGYAVGQNGYVIKTTNGGDSWYLLTSVVNDNLNDLAVIDQNTIIAVGDNGTVIKSIDGTNFNLIESTSGVTANLNAVHFYDDRIGWAAGDNGTFLITINEGQSWQSQTVIDASTNTVVTTNLTSISFFNLNDGLVVGENGTILKTTDGGYHFVNMSGRIYNGTAYQTINQLRPGLDNDINRVFVRREFANNFNISVYPASIGTFTNIIYSISPSNYPDSLVLQWQGALDGRNYIKTLDLDDYDTADDLATAVNQIQSPYSPTDVSYPDNLRKTTRVFIMTVDYANAVKPSDFRPASGSISSTGTTVISFSVEDKAWIVGNDGLVASTNNSGSKWSLITNNYGFDLYDVNMQANNYGWVVGSAGSILLYDPTNIPTNFALQNTDLPLKSKGRIFPEGNILSQSDSFLNDNMIDPNVGVETTDRVQIQYAIRVLEGVDPFTYPEGGLGAEYVYSLGPNATGQDAGSYTFENMGDQNGDYGLWRARCRNTYDGWSWAIPMFFVARRNSSPFDPDTNINGSTIYNLNAIRPDGLTYEQITDDDITDLRKKINIQSYTALFEKNFDKLLGNRLQTKLSEQDTKGTQYGTNILSADTYVGTAALGNLIAGDVTSEAVLESFVKILNPNGATPLTDADWTVGPTINCIYMTDPAYHSVISYINGAATSQVIPGYFEGLGTNTIKFDIGNYTPAPGEQYLMTVWRINYSNNGLTNIPNEPLGISYVPSTEDTSIFYRGINANTVSQIIEYLTANVPGYNDYAIFYSAKTVGTTAADINLYQSSDIYDQTTDGYSQSLQQFSGQQYRGSLVEYHYFFQTTAFVKKFSVPKSINNYGVLNVKSVANAVNGTQYLINSDYSTWMNVWSENQLSDLTYDNGSIEVFLDPSFSIPSGVIVEVILEVVPSNIDLNITTTNTGPNIQAYRAPFTSNFNVGSKGVSGFYKSVLYEANPALITNNNITVDLTQTQADLDLKNAIILGISSYSTRNLTYQSYVWFQSSLPNAGPYYYTVPVTLTTGLGTSTVVITIPQGTWVGSFYVPMLVQQTAFGTVSDNSEAYVFYKYRPYQTVGNLPPQLTVEVLVSSDFLYISNLGTGGSNAIPKDPYENPIEHIPVNDTTFVNDNMFTNIDDLDFTNFSIPNGLAKMPAIVSRKLGEDIIFSVPNNVGDNLGRTFYTVCSDNFRFQAEALKQAVPRKVFLPMVGRIRNDVTSPFVRGEIVLIIFSKVFKARVENETGYFVDTNVEYSPGYFEEADTAIAIYRLSNFPTVRM